MSVKMYDFLTLVWSSDLHDNLHDASLFIDPGDNSVGELASRLVFPGTVPRISAHATSTIISVPLTLRWTKIQIQLFTSYPRHRELCQTVYNFKIWIIKILESFSRILGSESFTRWLVLCKYPRVQGCERVQGHDSNVLAPPLSLRAKIQINSIIAVSPSHISGLTTQTALTDWQNIICRLLLPFGIFWAKGKVTTKVTLYEPPISKCWLSYQTYSAFCTQQKVYIANCKKKAGNFFILE